MKLIVLLFVSLTILWIPRVSSLASTWSNKISVRSALAGPGSPRAQSHVTIRTGCASGCLSASITGAGTGRSLNFHSQISSLRLASGFVENEAMPSPPQKGSQNALKEAIEVLYKFSRPHTIKGTILASFMGVLRALLENRQAISWQLVPRALIGLTALLAGNAYIVGINQIYDVKIDEINKPYLPIAAKRLSPSAAWAIVLSCLVTGVTIVKTQFSPFIFTLYMLGVVLGTIYSVPPFQFKAVPVLAGSIIAFVRGFLLNFGVYYAVREALGVRFSWNPVVAFIATFMTVFASVIAVTKDLSDIEGDRQYNISTLASKYGVNVVAQGAVTVLSYAYVLAAVLPWRVTGHFRSLPMSLGHMALLAYFRYNVRDVEATDRASIKRFYKIIWNLFYLEYCLYPFI